MTLNKSWISVFLCLILGLFLIQLPDWAYIPQTVGFIGLFGLCAYASLNGRGQFKFDGYSIFACLFIGMCILSLFVSDVTYSSLMMLPTYLVLPITFLCFRGHINTDILYKFLMALGCVCGVYVLSQAFIAKDWSIYRDFFYVNPNSFAVFLGICFIISLYSSYVKKQVWVYYILGAVFLCGIILTSSRGAILMLVLSSCLLSLLCLIRFFSKKNLGLTILWCGIFFLLYIYLPMLASGGDLVAKLDFMNDAEHEKVGSRFNIWHGIVNAVIDTHPIFGNGIGIFKDVYQHYRLPADYASGLHGHNDVLHLILEMGFIVLLPLGVLAITVIKQMIQNYKTRILPFSLLAFIAGCAMFTTIVLLPSLLLVTTVILMDFMQKSETVDGASVAKYANQIVAVVCVVVMVIQVMAFTQTRVMIGLKQSSLRGDLDGFRQSINNLDAVSFNLHPSAPIFKTSLLLTLWDEKIVTAPQSEIFEELNGYLEDAKARNPWNVEALYYEGQILKRRGDVEGAKHKWERALQIDPTYVSARLDLVRHTSNTGEAYSILKQGLHLKYWKQNPQKLYGLIMDYAQKQNDVETYAIAKERLSALLK